MFKSRPIDEVTLKDLLEWRAKKLVDQWSPYTVKEINSEIERRQKTTRVILEPDPAILMLALSRTR